jgi:hypothetical protein
MAGRQQVTSQRVAPDEVFGQHGQLVKRAAHGE